MLQEVDSIPVPYIGDLEIDGPVSVVVGLLLLVAGMMVFHLTDSVGQELAQTANSALGGVLPDAAGGDDGGVPGV